MAKRRIPKGAKLEYAVRAAEYGGGRKTPKALQHLWMSKEKRRTHKRERREGKSAIKEDS